MDVDEDNVLDLDDLESFDDDDEEEEKEEGTWSPPPGAQSSPVAVQVFPEMRPSDEDSAVARAEPLLPLPHHQLPATILNSFVKQNIETITAGEVMVIDMLFLKGLNNFQPVEVASAGIYNNEYFNNTVVRQGVDFRELPEHIRMQNIKFINSFIGIPWYDGYSIQNLPFPTITFRGLLQFLHNLKGRVLITCGSKKLNFLSRFTSCKILEFPLPIPKDLVSCTFHKPTQFATNCSAASCHYMLQCIEKEMHVLLSQDK